MSRQTPPAPGGRTATVMIRLTPEEIERIDAFINKQEYKPSRAEVTRRGLLLLLNEDAKPKRRQP